MRRIAVAAIVTNAVLAALVAVPLHLARTATPSPTGPDTPGRLDIADYDWGELLEGDGPPLERFAPDAFPDPSRPTARDDIPLPEGYPVDFRHYPTPEEINAFLDALAEDYPDLVEVLEIGETWQGRPIRLARVANERHGDALGDRPVMTIDAQHHARELISNQVALYTLWWLVRAYGEDSDDGRLATHLLDTRVVYILPSVNPDNNATVLADDQTIRKTANPACCDDDGDGRFDEDPVRGYGYGTDTVTEYEFPVEWADQHPDNPFQSGWRGQLIRETPLGRHTGALGGPRRPIRDVDADGDGRSGEDEVGGTDPNRNYDYDWENGDRNVSSAAFRGPAVWSEPEVRALRDFLEELDHLALAVSYHSGVDLILYPWAYSAEAPLPDAPLYELLGRKGSQLTEVNGFAGSPRTWIARGLYQASGSSVDYYYGTLGAYAFAPETYAGSGRTRIERLGTTGVFTAGVSTGFQFNPRPEDIPATTDRWNRYALFLLAATPNVELNALSVENGHLILTVGNDGALPVAVTVSLDRPDGSRVAWTDPEPIFNWQTRFSVPLAQVKRSGNRLALSATLLSGTRPHVVEEAEWVFSLTAEGAVRLDAGSLVPFADLGEPFGGWWAGEEWNAERYRCPRPSSCREIVAEPPAPPDPNRPPIDAPAVEGGLYLPRAEQP